jgi:peptidoglycan/LPS O-acetylase OafA/YrhL
MFLRFGRLYRLHLFFLLVFLGVEVAKYAGELKFGFVPYGSSAFSLNNTSSFIANLLLVQPFCPFANKTFNSPSWSIGVEFYTYLVFACVVLFASEKKKVSIISCFLVLLAASLLIFLGQRGLSVMPGVEFHSVHPLLLFGRAGLPDILYLSNANFPL